MLEKHIEAAFGRHLDDWCRDHGINHAYVKFEGTKGWPDRLLMWGTYDKPHSLWVEWKAEGQKLRPMQVHIHNLLKGMGQDVRTYDDYRVALLEVQEAMRATL